MTIGDDRRSAIQKLMLKHIGRKALILDIGAKHGSCTNWIKQFNTFGENDYTVLRVDGDAGVKPDILINLERGFPYWITGIEKDSVDLIVAGDIIEHIYNTHRLIPDLHKALKPGGKLIITVPNICSLKYRIAFMLGKIPSHAAEGDRTYPRRGHVRDFSYKELRNLLEKHKFRVIDDVRSKWWLPKRLGHTVIMCAGKGSDDNAT